MPASKKTPVEKLSRPPYARMNRIHGELKEDNYPNCSALGKTLEVASKTISRDIDFMRNQMGLPIEWDPVENGYFYSELVDNFPMVQVSEGELFSLLIAQKALESYKGTPYEKPLESAFRKISGGLRDKVFISLDRMNTGVSIKAVGIANFDLEIFQIVSRAVTTEQELEFEYKGHADKGWKKRRIQPWHICGVDGQWYVIGHDLNRKAKRTFALVRMRKVELTGEAFNRPKDFEIEEHLQNSLGVFSGGKVQTVKIEFSGQARRLVQEKSWHPSQEIRELENGHVELSLKLNDLWEIERWVLAWGGDAKVIAPAALRKSIRKHAEKILENSEQG